MYQNHNGIFRRMGCAFVALAVAGAAAACSRQEPAESTPHTETGPSQQIQQTTAPVEQPPLTVESVTEEGGRIVVNSSWCTVAYPFAFADLLRVNAGQIMGSPALCFTAVIGGEEYAVFDICFGRGDILLGELELPVTGEKIQVRADLHKAPEGLTEGQLSSFLAAQECFNDVSASLMEHPGFTPAD